MSSIWITALLIFYFKLFQDYTQADFDQQLAKAGQFDLILDFSGGKNDATYLPHLRKNCGSKFVSTSSPLLTAMDKKGILVKFVCFKTCKALQKRTIP